MIFILAGLFHTHCISAHSTLLLASDFLSAVGDVFSLSAIIWLNVKLQNICTCEHEHGMYEMVAWVIV